MCVGVLVCECVCATAGVCYVVPLEFKLSVVEVAGQQLVFEVNLDAWVFLGR